MTRIRQKYLSHARETTKNDAVKPHFSANQNNEDFSDHLIYVLPNSWMVCLNGTEKRGRRLIRYVFNARNRWHCFQWIRATLPLTLCSAVHALQLKRDQLEVKWSYDITSGVLLFSSMSRNRIKISDETIKELAAWISAALEKYTISTFQRIVKLFLTQSTLMILTKKLLLSFHRRLWVHVK